MSDIFSSASIKSVSIGKPEWKTAKFPGVVENIPVKLEISLLEKKQVKQALRPFQADYNKIFLRMAKSALLHNKKLYKGPLESGADISKVLAGPEPDTMLSLMLPETEESLELIDELIEAKTTLNERRTEIQALATLKRLAATDDLDPESLTLENVSKIHTKLKTQLAIFYQTEGAGVSDEYIDPDTKEFEFVAKSGDGDEADHESDAKK